MVINLCNKNTPPGYIAQGDVIIEIQEYFGDDKLSAHELQTKYAKT